jgi:hypothetical protein
MSLFEFTFALSAVMLGLALAHIAAVLHKLLLAGRRVLWASEPVLLTALVMLVIVVVWLGSWRLRDETSVLLGTMILQVLTLMTLYFTAASCLPEPDGGPEPINTYEYYDRTRLLSFGSLMASYVLFEIGSIATAGWPRQITFATLEGWFLFPTLYALLIFIRARWFNILTLSFALLYFGWGVMGLRLADG